jgi:hypothetical protein
MKIRRIAALALAALIVGASAFLPLQVNPGTRTIEPIIAVAKKSKTVYITRTGKKYHKGSCRYLKKSKIKTTKAKAKKQGYKACKVCKP